MSHPSNFFFFVEEKAKRAAMEKSWLPYYAPIKDPKLRLFAFHWAGGSAAGGDPRA